MFFILKIKIKMLSIAFIRVISKKNCWFIFYLFLHGGLSSNKLNYKFLMSVVDHLKKNIFKEKEDLQPITENFDSKFRY